LDIPNELKELYKTVWEIKQKHVITQAAIRGPFIDQTQSMNIFIEDANTNKMSSSHITAWKLGLKTGIYYFRTKPGANAIKFTINNNKFKTTSLEEDGCLNCSA
jgi:ribonucleotide reductase alpha subunit